MIPAWIIPLTVKASKGLSSEQPTEAENKFLKIESKRLGFLWTINNLR